MRNNRISRDSSKTRCRAVFLGFLAGGLALAGLSGPALAADPFPIHVVLPLTGSGAFLGGIIKANLDARLTSINRAGGIDGRPVSFIIHDDQTSPQHAVQVVQEILETHPTVILGSAVQAMCNAMAPLLANGPVLYCLSNSFRPAPGGYAFSSGNAAADMIEVLIRYFRLKGVTRLAVLNSVDATGQSGDQVIDALLARPENAGIKKVEHLHFAQSDVSVAAQVQTMKAADPEAVIAWTSGSPFGTVLKGIVQGGLEVPIGTTDANMTLAQMQQYASYSGSFSGPISRRKSRRSHARCRSITGQTSRAKSRSPVQSK